ncbi:hypothetical protein ACFLXY_02130 [Chloroflexota bacterium]
MVKFIKMLTMTLVLVTILLVSLTGTVLANGRIKGPDYDIEVSPNVLNIDSYGNSGNIHTNIPVASLTDDILKLTVNDTQIEFGTGMDTLGHLVIYFDMDTVEDILVTEEGEIAEEANFVLTCNVEGNSITVDDFVPVISVP